jgi:hypothetical protein
VSLSRHTLRTARRGAKQVWRQGTRRDATRLRRRLRHDPHWQEPLDGAAPRLDHHTRIEVTRQRVGVFRDIDPYRTAEGWRDGWKVAGFFGWAAVVGAAWWFGSSRGKGPLSILAEDHERAF